PPPLSALAPPPPLVPAAPSGPLAPLPVPPPQPAIATEEARPRHAARRITHPLYASRSPRSRLVEQLAHDLLPLARQRLGRRRRARAPVPVARVVLVAFLAVQVGVHARGLRRLKAVDGSVRARPVALAVDPERAQRGAEPRRRLAVEAHRLAKFFERHRVRD